MGPDEEWGPYFNPVPSSREALMASERLLPCPMPALPNAGTRLTYLLTSELYTLQTCSVVNNATDHHP